MSVDSDCEDDYNIQDTMELDTPNSENVFIFKNLDYLQLLF